MYIRRFRIHKNILSFLSKFNELIHPESIGSLVLVAVNQAIKTESDEKILEKIKELITL